MSRSPTPVAPAERDLFASEYVVGLLDAAGRAEAEALMRADPAFAAMVTAWEDRLAPLNDGYDPVQPPPALRDRIEARLFPAADTSTPLRRWSPARLLGGALAAAAMVAVALVLLPPPPPQPGPTLATELRAEETPLVFAASWSAATGRLQVQRTAGPPAATGSDYQLWLIGASGVPQSLGLLRGDQVETDLPGLAPGLVLAVSLEPEGGSPLPTPSGPVLMTGVLEPL